MVRFATTTRQRSVLDGARSSFKNDVVGSLSIRSGCCSMQVTAQSRRVAKSQSRQALLLLVSRLLIPPLLDGGDRKLRSRAVVTGSYDWTVEPPLFTCRCGLSSSSSGTCAWLLRQSTEPPGLGLFGLGRVKLQHGKKHQFFAHFGRPDVRHKAAVNICQWSSLVILATAIHAGRRHGGEDMRLDLTAFATPTTLHSNYYYRFVTHLTEQYRSISLRASCAGGAR